VIWQFCGKMGNVRQEQMTALPTDHALKLKIQAG